MRIVHVYKDAFPPVRGGVESVMDRMARHAAAVGADVTVLVSAHGERRDSEERVQGVRIVRCAEWARVASAPLCPGMPARLRRLPADVIHLHYPHPPGEVSYLLDPRRVPAVMTYHNDVVRQAGLMRLYRPLAERVLDRMQVIMPSSQQYLERSVFLRARRAKCQVVPLGIEIESFARLDRSSPVVQQLREIYKERVVLFVGRFRQYKGLRVLLHAMAGVPGTLVLVGGGPEEPALRELQGALGLGERVRFVGDVDDETLSAHYAAADVCVLPSIFPSEAFGMVLVESMAAGTPVITTELGTGTSFANQEGVTGLVIRPGDAEALAGALNVLLDDVELRARMGEAGRERVRRLFSVEAMMRTLLPIYERVARRDRD
jgi:rhamnosyl/mannosyltransferase